jgi:hypothetical protein
MVFLLSYYTEVWGPIMPEILLKKYTTYTKPPAISDFAYS